MYFQFFQDFPAFTDFMESRDFSDFLDPMGFLGFMEFLDVLDFLDLMAFLDFQDSMDVTSIHFISLDCAGFIDPGDSIEDMASMRFKDSTHSGDSCFACPSLQNAEHSLAIFRLFSLERYLSNKKPPPNPGMSGTPPDRTRPVDGSPSPNKKVRPSGASGAPGCPGYPGPAGCSRHSGRPRRPEYPEHPEPPDHTGCPGCPRLPGGWFPGGEHHHFLVGILRRPAPTCSCLAATCGYL